MFHGGGEEIHREVSSFQGDNWIIIIKKKKKKTLIIYANEYIFEICSSRFLDNVSGAGNMLPEQEMFPVQEVGKLSVSGIRRNLTLASWLKTTIIPLKKFKHIDFLYSIK